MTMGQFRNMMHLPNGIRSETKWLDRFFSFFFKLLEMISILELSPEK